MSNYTGSVPDTHTRPDEWRGLAACRADDIHPDLMFPDTNVRGIAEAKHICRPCPVWRECLLDAIATGDNQHGIRGGMRPDERRALARKIAAGETITLTPRKPSKTRKPRGESQPKPKTLTEAVARRIVHKDGHALWTGGRSLQFEGRQYTSWQAAFVAGHCREPVGMVLRTCAEQCVLHTHLTDAVIRGEKAAASGPRRERTSAKCGTRSGYQRHLREKTEICTPCRQANTDADNRLRRTGTTKAAA
ncbi:WhiB family transcriptional regulator [Streptomyces sp. NPDC002285]